MMTVSRLEGVHHSPVSNIYVYMHIYMRIYTQIHTYIHTDTYTYTHIGDEALECIIPEGARSDEDALHLNDMAGLLYMTAIVVFFAWLVNCWERWSLLPL